MAALGVLTLLVVVWAAAAPRPAGLIPGVKWGVVVEQQAPAETGVNDGEIDLGLERGPGPSDQTSDAVALVLGWATIAVLAVVAGITVFLIVRFWFVGHEDRTPPTGDAAVLDLDALALTMSTDAPHRLEALSAGTPAEGIIAAWTHLEATLHQAGVPLPPSRTSTEVSLDVLRRFSVDQTTLTTLAALYREARWSRHLLGEADRSRAARAYRVLDDTVRLQLTGGTLPRTTRGGGRQGRMT